jgi:hypothetical protein
VVSKLQIRSKGKARVDEKAQHTWEYVSILKRLATQQLGLRWGFETTSEATNEKKERRIINKFTDRLPFCFI